MKSNSKRFIMFFPPKLRIIIIYWQQLGSKIITEINSFKRNIFKPMQILQQCVRHKIHLLLAIVILKKGF